MKKYNYQDIDSLEKAYEVHPAGIDFKSVVDALAFLPFEISSGMINTMHAQVISYVINNDDPNVPVWVADYNDDDQQKWGWWSRGGSGDGLGSGFRFHGSDRGWTYSIASGGARFALKDSPRNNFMKETFPDVYKYVRLIMKQ